MEQYRPIEGRTFFATLRFRQDELIVDFVFRSSGKFVRYSQSRDVLFHNTRVELTMRSVAARIMGVETPEEVEALMNKIGLSQEDYPESFEGRKKPAH